MDDIWCFQEWWDQPHVDLVVLGDYTIEDLIELFPNTIYFYAHLEMSA